MILNNIEVLKNKVQNLIGNLFIFKLSIRDVYKRQIAFTLSEVLIALLIIGVVASIVIPGIINDTQDAELKIAWRKAFADISNATKMIKAQGNDIDFVDSDLVRNAYANVMPSIGQGRVGNIFAPFYTYYKNTSHQGWTPSGAAPGAAQLNGTSIVFSSYGGGATQCTTTEGSLTGVCGYILVDVNGNRAPNMYGKDLFQMWLVKKNDVYVVYPAGSNNDSKSCLNPSPSSWTSNGCSATALYSEKMP